MNWIVNHHWFLFNSSPETNVTFFFCRGSAHERSDWGKKPKWKDPRRLFKWVRPDALPSDLFPLLFSAHETPSASSAFASCSLSSLCKVISGISSSGASLWLGLIYIRFQTGAMNCGFFVNFFSLPFFLRFPWGVQEHKWATQQGGPFGRERGCTHAFQRFSFFALSFFLSFSLSEPCSCCSLFLSLPPPPLHPPLHTAGGLRAEDLLCRCSLFLQLPLPFTDSSEDHIHICTWIHSRVPNVSLMQILRTFFFPPAPLALFRPLSRIFVSEEASNYPNRRALVFNANDPTVYK